MKTVELNKLKAEIERVREKLHDLIEQKGSNLMDNEILYLSQLLDKLICEYHNAK
ncbi:MAG: aspartyl-phosphate phosphatase Spo0E family protein [Tissierellia bacterium]|nr:aspartyl-phosphate phosphatase Spo0E family protein [Tissierellia bacterium]